MRWQRTLRQSVLFRGVGLHSGKRVRLQVLPAPADTGIRFEARSADAKACSRVSIPARITSIGRAASPLCTRLHAMDGSWHVFTVEHCLAALAALHISNAIVRVEQEDPAVGMNGYELPILDGSSAPYCAAFRQVGLLDQESAVREYLRVTRPVQVLQEDKAAWLLPMPTTASMPRLLLSIQVDFTQRGLGVRTCQFSLGQDDEDAFEREIAAARTFAFEQDVARMQAHQMALGGSLENAVVFPAALSTGNRGRDAPPKVLNPDGLRFPDEWARHKLLDCIGDLSLVGMPLHAIFVACNPGHALTHRLVQELFRDEHQYDVVKQDAG